MRKATREEEEEYREEEALALVREEFAKGVSEEEVENLLYHAGGFSAHRSARLVQIWQKNHRLPKAGIPPLVCAVNVRVDGAFLMCQIPPYLRVAVQIARDGGGGYTPTKYGILANTI